MTVGQLLSLLLLGAIWGASFIFMQISAPEFGVILLVCLRALIAASVLFPIVMAHNQLRDIVAHWRMLCVVGVINTAIPFMLFSWVMLSGEVGYTAILNATAPMFAAIIAFFYLQERLSPTAVTGIFTGFSGVVLMAMEKELGQPDSLLPVFACLLATSCYGLAACLTKKHLLSVPTYAMSMGSQFFAGITLLPLGLWLLPEQMPSQQATLSLLVMAVVGTGFAYVLFFNLLAKVGTSKAMTVGYLVPLYGVLWGYLFADERLSVFELLGGVTILCGVAMTTGFVQPKKWFERLAKSTR